MEGEVAAGRLGEASVKKEEYASPSADRKARLGIPSYSDDNNNCFVMLALIDSYYLHLS